MKKFLINQPSFLGGSHCSKLVNEPSEATGQFPYSSYLYLGGTNPLEIPAVNHQESHVYFSIAHTKQKTLGCVHIIVRYDGIEWDI